MIAVAGVASAVARFVAVEVVEGLFAALRHWSAVAVMRVVAVVDMAVEVVVAAVPVAGADEDSAVKPVGPVVAVGRAVIGSVVVVAVGADRLHSEADVNLGWRCARGAEQSGCKNCECEDPNFGHDLSVHRSYWGLVLRGRACFMVNRKDGSRGWRWETVLD